MNRLTLLSFALLSITATSAQAPRTALSTYNTKLSEPQIVQLLQTCAPNAAVNTVLAVATTESAYHPYAISVNSPATLAKRIGRPNQTVQLERQPLTLDEAVSWMRWLLRHGVTVSVGLLQVNTDNAARFGITPEQLFDPCTNITVGTQLLADAFVSQRQFDPNDQAALLRALSIYNTGTAQLGFYNGYVAQILKNSRPGR